MKKETVTEQEVKASDGLENVVTGLGTAMDKSSHNEWTHSGRNLDHVELSARFREDWISQKVCTIVPQDMTRKWRTINTPEGQEADAELMIRDKFREAAKWARLYGTSFLVLDLKGSGRLDQPLNIDRLKPGCINSLQVVDRVRMYPVGIVNYDDPMAEDYGLPEHYQFVQSPVPIHKSRFIRFEGTDLPLYEKWRNQWYSDSTLIPLMDIIDNFHVASQSASALCQESLVDVVKVNGLQELLTNPQGEMSVMKRFRLMKQMKSIHNVLMLDDTEEYDTKSIALNGVKDLVWEYLRCVAAACSIPATRFLSASPDGMNATGQSDLVNYIEMLEGLQRSMFDPKLNKLDRIIAKHYGIEEYEYEWNNIFPESDADKIKKFGELVSSLKEGYDGRVITPEESRKILIHFFRELEDIVDPSVVPPDPNPKPMNSGGNNANQNG